MDDLLSRIQKNIKDMADTLTQDDDVLRVPAVSLSVTGNIQAGKSVVVFTGFAGQSLTLPQAKAQGQNVSAQIIVVNTSANAVTIIPTIGDTINSILSLSVPGGVAVLLSSDGITKWLSILGPGGTGGGGGGAGTLTDFTVDLGHSNRSGHFDITGLAGLTVGKNVLIVQTAQPIATKGNARDEFEFDDIQFTGYVVNAATIRVYWNAKGTVVGIYAAAYQVAA
jgi:hypothetical protein